MYNPYPSTYSHMHKHMQHIHTLLHVFFGGCSLYMVQGSPWSGGSEGEEYHRRDTVSEQNVPGRTPACARWASI